MSTSDNKLLDEGLNIAIHGAEKSALVTEQQLETAEKELEIAAQHIAAGKEAVKKARESNADTRQLIAIIQYIITEMKNRRFIIGSTISCLAIGFLFYQPKQTTPVIEQLTPNVFEKEVELGNIEANKGNHNKALEHFNNALKERPKSLTILGDKAYTLFTLDRKDESWNVCAEMLDVNPQSAKAYYIRGLIQKSRKKYDLALENFRLAGKYGETLAIHQIRIVEERR